MASKLIIKDIPPYDGEHEFEDFSSFTGRELHRIKQMTGLRVGEFEEALRVGDYDFIVAFAAITLKRLGFDVDEDLLWDAQAGGITFDFTEAVDPTQAAPRSPEGDSASGTDNKASSFGSDLSEPSENPENGLNPTGGHTLETPTQVLGSLRVTSAS